jgi:uncharacterized protein YecE (DUF72 family)
MILFSPGKHRSSLPTGNGCRTIRTTAKLLSKKRRYSFEFRHPSRYTPRILRLLGEQNISLCISDHHDAPAPWKRTADFVYVRGHGPGGRYKGHYRLDALKKWAMHVRSWKKRGCDVFVYFDNDQKSAAPSSSLGHWERDAHLKRT